VGLLKGTDLHLCLFGGVRPKNTIVPFDCFSGLDDIGKVNLKKGQRVEGMYDAGRVGMLPVWRGASGGTLADYLKPFGLRPCTFRDGDCVAVMFTVEMDGSITDAKIAVDKSTHAGLAAEALAVVRQMPKWSPAMADGLPVACRYVVRLTK
jgi:TonB family protein